MRGKGFFRRRRQATALAIVLAGALATASPAHAISQKLAPASPAGAKAGTSVAIDGNVAVLGAETEESARGAAYVFTRTGDTWTQTSRLIASDRLADDRFGSAVAIDGDTIVVGAYRDDHAVGLGSVYTFPTAGTGTRTQSAKLTLSTGNTPAGLGRSVAIDGNTIVAGTDGIDNTGISHIYTFARTGGDRNQTAILTAPQVPFEHSFGQSVDVDGDTIVAGDSSADPSGINSGALYTFTSTGADRGPTAALTATGGAQEDFLGKSVAIDGDTIVATAPGDDVGGDVDQGSAYTFTRTGVNRTQTAKLTASDGVAGDFLGGPGAGSVQGIAIGEEILVGAPNQDVSGNDDQGEVYRFARTGSDRSETGKLTDPDPGEFDLFGWSVAADGPLVLAGSINDTTGAGGCCHGSATVFFDGGGGSDTTPPDTEITKGPSNKTTKTKAKFEFTGTDDTSAAGDLTFECSLDGKPFADCTSPTTYRNLKKDKRHTFEVRATDEADNTDLSPAEDAWKVKK